MYTRIRRGVKNGLFNYCEFIADSESDLENLPTNTSTGRSGDNVFEPCSPGSKVYVTSGRKSYILGNEGSWMLFINYAYQGGSGGGSTSFDVEDDGEGNVYII